MPVLRILLAVFICLAWVASATAADYSGIYRSPDVILKLSPNGGGYAGILNVKGKDYPVTAREDAGALKGSFTVGASGFEFDASLAGQVLTLRSGRSTYELKREVAAQPTFTILPAPVYPTSRPAPPPPVASPTHEAALAFFKLPVVPQPDPSREWLITIYMNGDSNLDGNGAYNIEMMERGMPATGVDVLVLYDRVPGKTRDGEERKIRLIRLKQNKTDGLDSEVIKEFGTLDMTDPNLLAGFTEWTLKTFPARHYAHVAWNHGGGWQSLHGDDNGGVLGRHVGMTMPIFRRGLTDGMKAAGLKKWDLVLFDMCLMAQLEIAGEMHDIAEVMVASQELEPGDGVPYDRVLEAFSRGTFGGRRIGADIVAEFDKFYKARGTASTTLSAVDLTVYKDVNEKLNAVCEKVIPVIPKHWTELARSIFYAEQYTDSRDDFRKGVFALQSVDLLDTLKKCRASIPGFPAEDEYKQFVQVMDRYVIASANSKRHWLSNGVAIYAPVIRSAYDADYEKLSFYKGSSWPKLLKALYPEQAKNNDPPVFRKVELVDQEGKPVDKLKAVQGIKLAIEVEGKNIVWIRDTTCIRDPAFGGAARALMATYVMDENFLQKMEDSHKKFGQDIDIYMPQFADGLSKVRQFQYGMRAMMTNGRESVEVMMDNTGLGELDDFIVLADIEDPALGPNPVRAMLQCTFTKMIVETVILLKRTPTGIQRQVVKLRPESKVKPLFKIFNDDGTTQLASKESITWGNILYFHLDLMPTGDYETILSAETMTGAIGLTRFKYKVEEDAEFVASRQNWRNFKSEQMAGEWEWMVPAETLVPMNTTMTILPTKGKFEYLVQLASVGDDGKTEVRKGEFFLNLGGQPSFHMSLSGTGGKSDGAVMGPLFYNPETGIMLARPLGLEMNIIWRKKGGGPVAKAGPERVVPAGWAVVSDANNIVSLAVPRNLANQPDVVAMKRQIWPGHDFNGIDGQVMGVEIIRFDGERDPDRVLGLLIAGGRQLQIPSEFQPGQPIKIDGADGTGYLGRSSVGGRIYSVGINLIQTPRGIVAVNFAHLPQVAEQALPVLTQVLQSIRVAK